ncbi:MAG TPA: Crp/Fnr family transcriptional regulator [Treponemataceae bacterium]|nr:Crp/Fnr family transcriptional regulator [Treponemataceae bacterium]
MTANFYSIFYTLPPFHLMREEELTAFIQAVQPKTKSVLTGELTFTKAAYQGALTILAKGNFLCEIVTPSGKIISVNQVTAPSVIAAPLLFLPEENSNSHEASMIIRAKHDSEIVIIKKDLFRKSLVQFDSLLDGFLEVSAQRFSLLTKKLQYQALGDIKRKIALYLLELPRIGTTVSIPIQYTELAAHFAVERPSLSSVFKKLETLGLISRKKNRKIEILDIQGLENLLY